MLRYQARTNKVRMVISKSNPVMQLSLPRTYCKAKCSCLGTVTYAGPEAWAG